VNISTVRLYPPPRFTNVPGMPGACGPTLTTIPALPATGRSIPPGPKGVAEVHHLPRVQTRDQIAGVRQLDEFVEAACLVPALSLPDQPVTALVVHADLVAAGQDQQDLHQPARTTPAGDQLGDQRPQQPGIEPVEWGASVEDQDPVGLRVKPAVVVAYPAHPAARDITGRLPPAAAPGQAQRSSCAQPPTDSESIAPRRSARSARHQQFPAGGAITHRTAVI